MTKDEIIDLIIGFFLAIFCFVVAFKYFNDLPVRYDNVPVNATVVSREAVEHGNMYYSSYRYNVYIKIGDDTFKFNDPYIYRNYSDGQSCTVYYVTGYNKKGEIVSQEYCTSQKQID